jgi:hypothetical protein
MTVDGFWINNRIYWILWYSAWLHFQIYCYTHTPVFTVTSSLPLLGSGFQRQTFPILLGFLAVPGLSDQLLTATAHDWTPAVLWVKIWYDRRSVGQSVSVSSTHLGPMIWFLLLSDICRFLDLECPLWREDGSGVCNCCGHSQFSHICRLWIPAAILYHEF